MQVNFRQGLLSYQTDTAGNPVFLKYNSPGVDLIVSPDSTLMTFADGQDNYTFEENQTVLQAWPGPFLAIDYWLYEDINIRTAVRTFGYTTFQPVVGINPPPNPPDGQMWFNKNTNEQQVRVNGRWIRCLRVFTAKLASGAVLQPYAVGSQVGLWIPAKSGFILFDENDNPVQLQGPIGQQHFLTTDSPIASQFTGSAEFRLEGLIQTGTSTDNIPAWSAVALTGPGLVGTASNYSPNLPAIGVINEDVVPGEIVRIITSGFYTSNLINFPSVAPGTPLFVGSTGLLTQYPPQQFSIQQIAVVVSSNTIYVDVKPLIKYQG